MFDRCVIVLNSVVVIAGARSDETLVDPSLCRDLGKQCIEEREIGAGVNREMQDIVRSDFSRGSRNRRRAARINEDDFCRRDRFGAELGPLFVEAGAAQIGHPMVQEVVGLRLERIGAYGDNCVG